MKIEFRKNRNIIRRVDFDKRPSSPVKEILEALSAKRERAGLRKERRGK